MDARSEQACKGCKKQKRRCDKDLPECGLCLRTGRVCEYGMAPEPLPTADDWVLLQQRLSELENRLAASSAAPAPGPTPASSSTHNILESVDPSTPAPGSIASTRLPPDLSPPYSGLEGTIPRSAGGFPASMFLDIDFHVWFQTRLPSPQGAIPPPVLALLNQGNGIPEVSQEYFSTVHTWMPMVSKKRMDMGLPVQNAGPDIAVLFLGMKLITTHATDITDGGLYATAKDFLALLEKNGTVSLVTLQAMILVALYEYGHGIFPAAWMTVGACARYSEILGLPQGETSVLGPPTTWTEVEERRRVWWSIFILDRILSMGNRKSCAMPSPLSERRLPVDDEAWDSGDVRRAAGHSTSIPYQVEQSGFARLCQASVYLSQALDYARGSLDTSSSQIPEIMSLAHDLTAFASIVDKEAIAPESKSRFSLLAPRCIIRSALFIALDRFTCPERIGSEAGYVRREGAKTQSEISLQRQSMQIIELQSQQLHAIGMDILAESQMDTETTQHYALGHVGPLILDAMYAGAATFYWMVSECGEEVYGTAASDLGRVLEALGSRWRLGSAYRDLLKMHDASVREGARVV